MTNLATLTELKDWLKATSQTFTNGDDAFLNALILRVSNIIMDYVSLSDVVERTVLETRNGTGSVAMMLREWPVRSVISVRSGAVNIPQASSHVDSGYVLAPIQGSQPQAIMARGYGFPPGLGNVSIEYVAGFVISDERHTINAQYNVTATQPRGSWARAESVVYATSGTALTEVASDPAVGEYAIDPNTLGKYLFNSADEGEDVLITYSYVPAALVQACVEWVAERYSYRTRVGQQSRSQGGQETTSFSLKDMPDFIKLALQPYVRVIPC